MGKGMTFKKKRKPLTMKDLEEAQKQIDAEVEKATLQASQTGTLIAQELIYLALHRIYGFGCKKIQNVQNEADRIAESISDGTLTINDIQNELLSFGVGVENVN